MKRIMITGGSGVLGSAMLPLLGEYDLHLLGRGESPAAGGVAHPFDLGRQPDYSGLPKSIDAFVYLAQSRHFREFPERALDIFEVNSVQLLRSLDYARRAGARVFIYTSTGGVYRAADRPFRENDPLDTEGQAGFYSASKLCAEFLVRQYRPFFACVILRPFFIYGPSQQRHMLLPRLADRIRAGEAVRLQGRNGITLNPAHASDAARAVAAALRLEQSEVINIAGPQTLSLRQIAQIIAARLGVPPLFEQEGDDAAAVVGDITKMTRLLGAPIEHFAEHVDETL